VVHHMRINHNPCQFNLPQIYVNLFGHYSKPDEAYTESFDIGPELIRIFEINHEIDITSNHSLRRKPVQSDIIEVHNTCTTGHRIGLIAKTKSNSIYIGKVYTLVSKARQVDSPFRPGT
jgi:hypothetical protein